jgi:uncharacterized RDD family membrane protein YckC
MSSAAQRDETTNTYPSIGTDGGTALKQLAAERLAAHRNRRAGMEGHEAQARREQAEAQAAVRLQARRDALRAETHPDVSRVREAVAARYQQSLSYREFLAAEAQRATAQAHAEAEVAARNAKAVAAAQQQLLEEMEQWAQPSPTADPEALFAELPVLEVVERAPESAARIPEGRIPEGQRAKKRVREDSTVDFAQTAEPKAPFPPAQLQVRLHEEIEWTAAAEPFRVPSARDMIAAEELAELDEEIEFRLAPEFHDLVLETQSIPGNIIEFPRELVASRRARPRLAEGPLLSDGTPEPQLRIFEVEPAQISAEPEMPAAAEAPEWQGLLLSAGPAAQTRPAFSPQLEAQLQLDQQFYAAPVSRRVLSATIDALCVGAGLATFSEVVVKIAGDALHATPKPLLAGAAAGTFALFALIYQLLFFTLNDATPGMRAARIAFCTFRETNPTRQAIRRRLVSTALAACPLGLGLVWMLLDGDRLGWHDRMSRMYPRAY